MFYDKIFFERTHKEHESMSASNRIIVDQIKKKNHLIQQIRKTKQVQLIGESMMPTLDPLKILTLFVSDRCDFKIGDVIVFEYKRSISGMTVHRIIKKKGRTITTKGDNNILEDENIDISAVIGKVEKALTTGSSVIDVKSSKFAAILSRFEGRAACVFPKRISVFIHGILIKMYGSIAQKR